MVATDIDIAICGAGPVGLALGGLLVRNGLPASRIVLIDGKTLEAATADPRTIALSAGSRQLLERIGAWPVASDPIREIHVSRRGHFGRTLLKGSELGVSELGYVCRYGALVERLAQCASVVDVPAHRPLRVQRTDESEDQVAISLDNGSMLAAQLLIQAEGGLFGQQPAKPVVRNYRQTAIISHVQCSAMHDGRAWERFTEEGPLALLPQENGYALVWCMRPERAEALMRQDDASFLTALQHAFGQRVGRFTRVADRHQFPLGLNADPARTRRTVAIGNAAQTLHPVAGQGFNLGLRDAAVLADLLARELSVDSLARFADNRVRDRRMTIRLTDAMARVFAGGTDGSLSQSVLGLGLGLIDASMPAKRMLAEQMMYGWRG